VLCQELVAGMLLHLGSQLM